MNTAVSAEPSQTSLTPMTPLASLASLTSLDTTTGGMTPQTTPTPGAENSFQRAMAEPIAENAALGEAFAAAVAATIASPASPTTASNDVSDDRVVSDVRPGTVATTGDVSDDGGEMPAVLAAAPNPTSLTPPTSLATPTSADSSSVTAADVVRAQVAATVVNGAAPTEASAPAEVLVQAANAVADTLLVSPGLLRGQGEIVVQLRPDVLDGTEVRIAVTGRQLDVQFCPTTVDMSVMLENGRTQIANCLSAKIAAFNVTVDVRKKRA